MKIAVITHNYIRRQGDLTALYLHRLAAGLAERGMEIKILCPHAPGLLPVDNIDGVAITRFKYPFWKSRSIVYTGNMQEEVSGSLSGKIVFAGLLRSFYREGLALCKREEIDLIWANWWIPPGLAAARIASKLKRPLVISSHGSDLALLGKPGLVAALSNYVYRRTSKATVVSSFLREKLLQNVDVISPDNIAVIPMPVGMEYFPRTEPPHNDRTAFLSVARFTRQKRLTDLISAADLVRQEGFDFNVIMIGEGPLENELKEMVASKNLTDNFEILPLVAQQKLGEFYRACDVTLLVSENEGFGLVLVEAGLTGRPTIGARSGGIVDFIENEKTGLLIEPGDIKGLAQAMKRIITDRELCHRLGAGAYLKATESFSTPVLVGKIFDLFSGLKN